MWNEVNFIEFVILFSLGENEFIDVRLECVWIMDEKEVNRFSGVVLKYEKEFWGEWGGKGKRYFLDCLNNF